MSGSSTYPVLLDTDNTLYRVSPGDPQTVGQHNAHTDALETIEAVVGVLDDGTGPTGAPAFDTGVAHYAGLLSTSQPNPCYPWVPENAKTIMGFAGALPAAWTLGGGITLDWTKPNGWMRIPLQDAGTMIASCNLDAGNDQWIAFRWMVDNLAENGVAIGFSVAGDGSDLNAILPYSGVGSNIGSRAVQSGTRQSSGSIAQTFGLCAFYLHWNSTTGYEAWGAPFGWPYITPVLTWASDGTPTKLCIFQETQPTTKTANWLQFLAYGTTTPSTYHAL